MGFFHLSNFEKTYIPVFGEKAVIVRPFDRSLLVNGDIVDDFCATVGIPKDIAGQLERTTANESLSMEAALLANAVSRGNRMFVEGEINADRIKKNPAIGIRGARFRLPKSVIDCIRDDAAREVAYVKERFGIDLPAPIELDEASRSELWSNETINDIGDRLRELATESLQWRYRASLAEAELALAQSDPHSALKRLKKLRVS